MLQLAASTFEVIQFQIERGGPQYAALCRQLPRLEPLVQLLLQRRSEPDARYGQHYARELIERGTFELPSLTTDGSSRATGSLLLNDKSVFYTFDGDPDLIVGASFLAGGFPLTAIVIPSRRVMINLGDPIWGMGMNHLRTLQRLSSAAEAAPDAGPAAPSVAVVTGDPNFAHHVWNQLSAFDELTEAAAERPLQIIATHQPLGPLTELFPEAANWMAAYCPDTYLEGRNGPNRMFAPLGSFLISRKVQRRLKDFATAHLSPEIGAVVERIAAVRRPTFWLSIRTRNRTATNQVDALAAVAAALFRAFPTACVLLDGHSLPADFAVNPSYDRDATMAIVEADRAVAREVISRLLAASAVGPDQEVIELIGCDILDSIAVASLADLYFCHHGTVQHKIGWTSDVPGIVHCNGRTLALRPARWVAEKVEDGMLPIYIDDSFVEDEAPSGELSDVEKSLRVECYRFTNVERLATFVLETAQEIVGDLPPPHIGRIPSVREDSSIGGPSQVAGERTAMSKTDTSSAATFADLEHVDRLSLQRELLRVRNELALAQKTKEAVTAELVRVCGDLREAQHAVQSAAAEASALRDELASRWSEIEEVRAELSRHVASAREQQAELTRRTQVGQQLRDELVRRDLEVREVRDRLADLHNQNVGLQGELDRRSFTTEGILSTIAIQRAAIARLERAAAVPASGTLAPTPPVSVPRRIARRIRRVLHRVRTLVIRTQVTA